LCHGQLPSWPAPWPGPVDMNGQPPMPVASHPGKEPPLATKEEAGWAPVSMDILQKRNISCPCQELSPNVISVM